MASLGLRDDTVVIQLDRIRLLNGEPVAIQTAYLPYGLCPAVLDGPLIDDSLYATLAARAGVQLGWAQETIAAVALNDHQSALLHLPLGSPSLYIVRLTYDIHNMPVEYVESFMRPDRRFTVELKR
jgi:GntR family transcriptional regulator